MVRYSFPVGLFHSLFHAGLSRRLLGVYRRPMPLFDFWSLPSRVNDARITKQSIMEMFYRNVILGPKSPTLQSERLPARKVALTPIVSAGTGIVFVSDKTGMIQV